MKPPKTLDQLVSRLLAGNGGAPAVQATSLPLPGAVRLAEPARQKSRTKLWDLEEKHLCPVVGTCVPMHELARFANRYRFDADPHNEFAMHVEAVCYAKTRNAISEALQRHLDHKYAQVLARFNRLRGDDDVLAEWKACLARGEVAGPLWAAYTHKAASELTRHRIYEDIHMLSHQVGAGQATDARRLAHLEREHAALKAELADERTQLRRLRQQLGQTVDALERATAKRAAQDMELDALHRRLAQHESGERLRDLEQQLERLRTANAQMAGAMQRVWDLDRALRAAREEADGFARERDLALAERGALEQVLMAAAAAPDGPGPGNDFVAPGAPDAPDACDSCDSAGSARCVLCVGGRTSLLTQYRELAGRVGIRLLHHDGGQEESLSRLPEMIHGADAVVCPTDCVSHSAYYHLKNQCKRIGKPVLFFKGASVSSFALAMTRVAGGDYSLAGRTDA
jgi:hypothetical protein